MRILLDECVPKSLGKQLSGHLFSTVAKSGWARITNGKLLRLAQSTYDAFITVDQNMSFQINFEGISITVIVIEANSNAIEDLEPFVPELLGVLSKEEPSL